MVSGWLREVSWWNHGLEGWSRSSIATVVVSSCMEWSIHIFYSIRMQWWVARAILLCDIALDVVFGWNRAGKRNFSLF